ncbi:dihydroorotase [Dysgonomonas capnocytophagoides]|uniref:Dihydroorotase n=1 Tax=Dysgonomonas capnocytophagoides TaxID=45254 RepID=A0A4Y8KVL8_9BACT|nr:dihydroorotase [Dysgonomonas capnocytophagoides]TFD93746.1 dihydroorotase [Dysgonomonas capnocytophagoides]
MYLIHNATIINEGKSFTGSVLVDGELIQTIYKTTGDVPQDILNRAEIIDGTGRWLIPGVIDDQVHFRDPGLTHKGDITTESKAAIAGGVTSYMEMPNTKPQTTTIDALNTKFESASERSYSNYSFYLGATNDNLDELKKVDKKNVCGIKIFMGSSTGNMLVDKRKALESIFGEIDMLIATHCEEEEIIQKNIAYYKGLYDEDAPVKYHPLIRSAEACYQSSAKAIELADKHGARLHILHLSTAREISLFDIKPLINKKITGEVCVHHLWFSDEDYEKYGTRIKWNPAVKTKEDREALMKGLLSGKLDVIATDHAPHLLEEKIGGCFKAASGGPLVQHSLQMMLELAKNGKISKEDVVDKMCHAPATLFRVHKRGYIREGYFADLVLVNPEKSYTITQENILYKCKWSPLEGETVSSTIEKTFLNGQIAFENGIIKEIKGRALTFDY